MSELSFSITFNDKTYDLKVDSKNTDPSRKVILIEDGRSFSVSPRAYAPILATAAAMLRTLTDTPKAPLKLSPTTTIPDFMPENI